LAATIEHYQRPCGPIADEIVRIAELLTEHWFTLNVPEDTRRDLLFHDALCLIEGGRVRSFLVFTSRDGRLEITLIGTDPACRGRGYGSLLMERFLQHGRDLGYEQVVAMTVPPEVKPAYAATVAFYKKHGFVEARRYTELWESGALELVRDLTPER
jgi:ribosomal protein S18 acetylase RimI-like enzyme